MRQFNRTTKIAEYEMILEHIAQYKDIYTHTQIKQNTEYFTFNSVYRFVKGGNRYITSNL